MAIRPYVGEEALRELVRQIKARTASVYTVKGSIGVCTYDDTPPGEPHFEYNPANLPYYIWGTGQGPAEWKEHAHIVDGANNIIALQEGWVFNLAVDYTVTTESSVPSPFIDKERGEVIKAGTNICIVNVGVAENPVYKYDCLATDVDLTSYQTKLLNPANTMDYGASSIIVPLVTKSIHGIDYNADPASYLPAPSLAYYTGQIISVTQSNQYGTQRFTYYVFLGTSHGFVRLFSTDSATYPAMPSLLTIERLLQYISAYAKNVKQDKKLSSALTILTPDFTYATVAAMPTTGATAEGIETGDIAYVTETTKLYQATVDGSDNITWAEIGDQTTVEGAIKLLGSLAPNKPVTAAEVQSLFNV